MSLDQLQARLNEYIARHPEQLRGVLGPLARAGGGGWTGGVYTFTLQRAEASGPLATPLVLKIYLPTTGGSAHALREWGALTRLRATNYPVPQVILLEEDARHLGHPFIVMEYIPSASFWHTYETADPITQPRLTRLFVTQLVTLHALDPHIVEPSNIPRDPYSYIERELDQLRLDAASSPHVRLDDILQWLEQRKQTVPCVRPAILHRDYHPWNVLIDAGGQPWIIDWDWQIGDARFDLAWTCTIMQRSDFPAFSCAVRDNYARQSDRPLGHLNYFEVLTSVRWLLNVLPGSDSVDPLDPDTQEQFLDFLIGPLRRTREFLQDSTGIDVHLTDLENCRPQSDKRRD